MFELFVLLVLVLVLVLVVVVVVIVVRVTRLERRRVELGRLRVDGRARELERDGRLAAQVAEAAQQGERVLAAREPDEHLLRGGERREREGA